MSARWDVIRHKRTPVAALVLTGLRLRWARYSQQLVYWERDPLIAHSLEPRMLYRPDGARQEVEI